ncbi:hypothetical protein DPMN_090392 [Dreissena polymorpha]|uniref:Uncharacterized protein n=1 Tax=Dreissena polymorpha TaxID=45954 RepID=A0A9D4QYA4_DREPO|nr:hypothetical protein DPMN_090392 [Dreissena polymorpha]
MFYVDTVRYTFQISIEECEKHRKEKIQRNYSALLLPGKILHIEQRYVHYLLNIPCTGEIVLS